MKNKGLKMFYTKKETNENEFVYNMQFKYHVLTNSLVTVQDIHLHY